VAGAKFDEAVHVIRPDEAERILAAKFEISGLPFSCGAACVQTLIPEWKIQPLFTYKQRFARTWVGAAEAPPPAHKIQHEEGLAIIQKHERTGPRKSEAAPIWKPPSKPAREVTWPECWSDVAKKQNATVTRPQVATAQSLVPAAPAVSTSSTSDLQRMIQELASKLEVVAKSVSALQKEEDAHIVKNGDESGRPVKRLHVR
jgi:hypothetical protein